MAKTPSRSNERSLFEPDIFTRVISSTSLTTVDKEQKRIAQEGFVVQVADGETTARILTIATFFLLANKDSVLRRLREEVRTVMTDPNSRVDVKSLEQLPWLVIVQSA